MSSAIWVVTVFGIFSIIGGCIGWMKARSAASLMAGTLSGGVLLFCAAGLRQGSTPAAIGALFVAAALGGRFAMTWRRTRRLMPDLVMVLFSVATLLAVGSLFLR